jgi:L-alanine-DL-glutamate epimerase-like enolase superfamily enzyme
VRPIGVIRGPAELVDALSALPVHISSVRVRTGAVALEDYPGGPRPTSLIGLAGDGQVGFGENVAFDAAEHDRFAAAAERALGAALGQPGLHVGEVLASLTGCSGYERAAVEAALVDLAMRQRGKTLAELTGISHGPLRFVESFAARRDPAAHVQRLRARGHNAALKIDVDPTWDGPTRQALARQPGIAILDFKGRGDTALARAWAELLPTAILEDPPAGVAALGGARVTRDAPLVNAGTVADTLRRCEGVNLKAPRMGGPLEVLRGLDLAWRIGGTRYLGGMFEVSVGRMQARQLAALYACDGPNDLALIGRSVAESSPATVRLDTVGFGACR